MENDIKSQEEEKQLEKEIENKLSDMLMKSQKLLQIRKVEELIFNGLIDRLSLMMNIDSEESTVDVLDLLIKELKEQYSKFKICNNDYID